MWWTLVGGVLEAVGLGVTGRGIYKTPGWGQAPTNGFWTAQPSDGHATRCTRRTDGSGGSCTFPGGRSQCMWTRRTWCWWAGRSRPPGKPGFPPLDPALTTAEALAVLDQRVRDLLWMTDQNRKADLVKLQAVEAKAADTAGAVVKVQADLMDAKRDLAVHGLRTEAWAWPWLVSVC
jgi:hypothetical protein